LLDLFPDEITTTTRRSAMSLLAESCPPCNRTGRASPKALIDERVHLLNNGFVPTPCDGKRALLDGWASIHAPTESQINGWSKTHPRCQNTGLLTRLTPGFDIDILDEHAAQAVEDLTVRWFAERGLTLVRVGLWPKRLILFWTDKPFKKIAVTFVDGGKLEVLCDGQQFVAFGIHPDTGRPYTWEDGRSPLNVGRDELPYITEAEARALVAASVKLLADNFDYRVLKPPRPEPPPGPIVTAPFCGGSRYGAVALAGACAAITCAPCGDQESTLNKECFSIGQLVGAGVIDHASAMSRLMSAASAMPSYDARRPWTHREVVGKVNRAFAEGQQKPRKPRAL
jgi:hypothetical protein